MIINKETQDWTGVGFREFCEGKDYRPPESYYARNAYQNGWYAGQDSHEALDERKRNIEGGQI